MKVLAQSNHPSARIAAEIARRNEELGADVISFAIPRRPALERTSVPLLRIHRQVGFRSCIDSRISTREEPPWAERLPLDWQRLLGISAT